MGRLGYCLPRRDSIQKERILMYKNNEEIRNAYEKEFGEREIRYEVIEEFTFWDLIGVSLSVAGIVMLLYVLAFLIFH